MIVRLVVDLAEKCLEQDSCAFCQLKKDGICIEDILENEEDLTMAELLIMAYNEGAKDTENNVSALDFECPTCGEEFGIAFEESQNE